MATDWIDFHPDPRKPKPPPDWDLRIRVAVTLLVWAVLAIAVGFVCSVAFVAMMPS